MVELFGQHLGSFVEVSSISSSNIAGFFADSTFATNDGSEFIGQSSVW